MDAADSHRVAVVAPADSGVGATIAEALGRHRRLLLEYFVPARDEVTSREVDPIAITTIDGQRYLRAWCRSAEGLRHFRLDRIESAKIIDRPAAAPAMDLASEPEFLSGEFTARLRLGPDALWLIDHLGATVVTYEEGSRIVEVAYSESRLILAIGRQVGSSMEILEPRELRDLARHQAEAALANYALK